MKTRIHINQHIIKANRVHGENNPAITVKTYRDNRYAHTVGILDANGNEVARVVYRPHNPLSCGAHVWIETDHTVVLDPCDELGDSVVEL